MHPILDEADLAVKVRAVLGAIRAAEKKKGRPVHLLDILKELKRQSDAEEVSLPQDFIFTCQKMCLYVFEIYRNDELLSDKSLDYFSLDVKNQCTSESETRFELCSDRLAKEMPGYAFDERGRVRPGESTPTVNLDQLKELLLDRCDRR